MSKKIKLLGKTLNRDEQKAIQGGERCPTPQTAAQCAAAGGYWFGTGCLYPIDYCL